MSRRRLVIAAAGSAVLLVLLLWWAVATWVTAPAQAIQSRIDAANASLERRRTDLDRAEGVNDRIGAMAARTLGSTTEAVDHALRSRLAALSEAAAVSNVRVGTSAPIVQSSPGRREFRGRQRALGSEPDFLLVPASVAARGTWQQVGLLVESIQAEPWPHRITRLRLAARDGGALVEVAVQLEALFIPGKGPLEPAAPGPPLAATVALSVPNPFAPPASPPPPPGQVEPAAPAVPWKVVHIGLIRGESEVILKSDGGKRRRLVVGDSIRGMTLEAVGPDPDGIDQATFSQSGATWRVQAGQALQRP